MILVILPLFIALPLHLISKHLSHVPSDIFSPGDSRLVSFSSFFCNGINLTVGESATGTSATIITVNSTPSLTEKNIFNVTNQLTLKTQVFHSWKYYLYNNANISINVCSPSQPIDVYLVKGKDKAKKWLDSPSAVGTEIFRQVLCPPDNQTIMYNVLEEDEYYVFLFNSQGEDISYNITLQFERFEYALPPANASLNSCFQPSGGQCILDIPYGTGFQQALVLTSVPANVDWAENVNVNLSCNERGWAIALVILIPIIVFVAAIIGCIAGTCYWLLYGNSKDKDDSEDKDNSKDKDDSEDKDKD